MLEFYFLHVAATDCSQPALAALLTDPNATPKAEERALLLTHRQWSLAEDMVMVLDEFERATTVVSGQQYVTLSLLLPIVDHLHDSTIAVATKCKTTPAKSFAKGLAAELTAKFPISAVEPDLSDSSDSSAAKSAALNACAVLSAALDPRFRDLSFLDAASQEAVREVLLKQMSEVADLAKKSARDQPEILSPGAPPSKQHLAA